MTKLEQLLSELCPNGVEFKKVKDVFKRIKGTPITAGKMKEIEDPEGEIRIFAGGKTVINAKESDIPNANITRVPAVLVQSRGVIDVIFYEKPFTFKNEMWAYTADNRITVKFLYYVLKNNILEFREAASGMGALPQISLPVTEEFLIPMPPLPVQREIVRILDNFTELTTELTTELAARKQQYEYYRDHLLTFSNDVPQVELGDYFPHIRNGFVGTATPYFTTEEDGIRYLKGTNIHNGIISDNDYCYITPAFHQKHIRNELKADDILVVQSGHVGECAVVGEKYAGANCHALIIMSNGGQCSSKFVVHYLHSAEGKRKIAAITTGGTVKHVLASEMKKFKIPFPPIAEQERIVALLDRFDFLCHDITLGLPAEIEARKKQYEYYRDKLLTFKERVD